VGSEMCIRDSTLIELAATDEQTEQDDDPDERKADVSGGAGEQLGHITPARRGRQ